MCQGSSVDYTGPRGVRIVWFNTEVWRVVKHCNHLHMISNIGNEMFYYPNDHQMWISVNGYIDERAVDNWDIRGTIRYSVGRDLSLAEAAAPKNKDILSGPMYRRYDGLLGCKKCNDNWLNDRPIDS